MACNINPQHLLTRYNYSTWVKNITRILEVEGLKVWIESSEKPKTDTLTYDNFRLKQSKSRAAGLLKSYCSTEIELEINHLDDPLEIWDTLKKLFQHPSRSYKAYCLAEFKNIVKAPDEELPTFVARFEESYRKIEEAGETISENHRCFMLLQCLGDDFDYLAREFENCAEDQFLFKNLKDQIIKEYNRKNLRELNKTECLLTDKDKPVSPTIERRKVICTICKKIGHLARVCRNRRNDSRNSSFVTEYVPECYENSKFPLTREWILDSASTSHICQNKEFFTSLKPSPSGSIIKMGTTPHKVQGIGTVEFDIREGPKLKRICLKDTLYVPTIHRNLVSMSRMDNVGMHAKLDRGFKIFSPRWNYLWSARLRDKFYVLKGIPIDNVTKFSKRYKSESKNTEFLKQREGKTDQAYMIETNNIMLWHERLAHSNLASIKRMFREKLVEPEINLKGEELKCEACIFGKSSRTQYPRVKAVRSKEVLELVHTDVWGPAPFTAKHGYRYIITFVDDYSRRLFCYPMRRKDEVFIKLKNFINFIERQTNRKIHAVRSDNGLEYCSNAMKRMLNEIGIKHERTNYYSPQQNGVAERANRVLFEGTRTLLQSANLPDDFWLEALQTVNYIRNRVIHRSIDDIPFRRWYGRKPTLKHLKRYGCTAYVHIPPQKRNKLEPRAKKGIMVGYSYGTRGYRIWIPESDSIIESKHVTFDEKSLGKEREVFHFIASEFDDDDIRHNLNMNEIEEKPEEKEKTDDETESKPGTSKESEYLTELGSEVKFQRIVKERQKGMSKGKQDIYVLTPDGKTLRSTPDLRKYCQENDLEYDELLNVFSKDCQIEEEFILKRKTKENIDSEPDIKINEANCVDIIIPRTPREAMKLPEAKEWKRAMDIEYKNMLDREVWTPVPKTTSIEKIIGTRWIFTLKNKEKTRKYKARLVALGNNQREGLDYNETYSPVVNFVLIRLFIALFICVLQWQHSLLDVKCAYLYGTVDKDIYIAQPANYVIPGKETHVLKLNKALYGLHQAGRCWFEELHMKLIENGFEEIPGITCVYRYGHQAIVMVYVDDLPIFAKNKTVLNEVINILENLYEVENLGPIKQLLGIQFDFNELGVNINCSKYIDICMKKFNLFDHANTLLPLQPGIVTSLQEMPSTESEKETMKSIPYRNLLGCLLYISGRCRPDISYGVTSLSQVVENPGLIHWNRLTQLLKYLGSTKQLGLLMMYSKPPLQLAAYTDASWASDPHDRRSWSGYSIFLNKAPVTWRVIKQTCVAMSPMESEFISASETAKDLKYLTSTLNQVMSALNLTDLRVQLPLLFCDNSASIQFTKNRAENIRNRYIDLRYMFIRELFQQGYFDIKHVKSQENLADLMTKALSKDIFLKLRASYLAKSE